MYPIHDIDAQSLLAILMAAKRRPATLPEIVAAADVLGWPVESGGYWAEAIRRLSAHGLVVLECDGYAPTASAQEIASELPKKVEGTERVFLLREKLSRYMPEQKSPAVPLSTEHVIEAIRAHAALASQGGKNLLMPKPKPDEDAKRPQRKPFGARHRR